MDIWMFIRKHEDLQRTSCFFSRDNLRFFGERISDMRVLERHAIVDGRECYVLSSLQRNYPLGQRRQHFYFAVDNFEYLGPKVA